MGFFDRYVSKKGWPHYILGTDPLISVVAGEASFEEQALLLTNGYCQESKELQLYQASSYYNDKTGSFYLTNLKRMERSLSLKRILSLLRQKNNVEEEVFTDLTFQLLSPHEEEFNDTLKSHGLFPQEFLEWDQDLKWLWPRWKRVQMQVLRKRLAQTC